VKFGTIGEVLNALKLGALDKDDFHRIDLATGCLPAANKTCCDVFWPLIQPTGLIVYLWMTVKLSWSSTHFVVVVGFGIHPADNHWYELMGGQVDFMSL